MTAAPLVIADIAGSSQSSSRKTREVRAEVIVPYFTGMETAGGRVCHVPKGTQVRGTEHLCRAAGEQGQDRGRGGRTPRPGRHRAARLPLASPDHVVFPDNESECYHPPPFADEKTDSERLRDSLTQSHTVESKEETKFNLTSFWLRGLCSFNPVALSANSFPGSIRLFHSH